MSAFQDPLRIIAWNVHHAALPKCIPAVLPDGILWFKPDVVVLTEYVEGPNHDAFCKYLKAGGLTRRRLTPKQPGCNQVLIASRSVSTLGTFKPPDNLPHAVSNCLHVRLANPSLDVVGLRVPCEKPKENRSYWNWFEQNIPPELFKSPTVIIGDLNADPRRSQKLGTAHLLRLKAAGWKLPDPDGPWSYIGTKGTSRLDHALVSPRVTVRTAKYITSVPGYSFAGLGVAYLSDHALLVLDVTVPRAD